VDAKGDPIKFASWKRKVIPNRKVLSLRVYPLVTERFTPKSPNFPPVGRGKPLILRQSPPPFRGWKKSTTFPNWLLTGARVGSVPKGPPGETGVNSTPGGTKWALEFPPEFNLKVWNFPQRPFQRPKSRKSFPQRTWAQIPEPGEERSFNKNFCPPIFNRNFPPSSNLVLPPNLLSQPLLFRPWARLKGGPKWK